MKFAFLFLSVIFLFQPILSQPLVDSISKKEKKWEFDFQIDQRNTIFLNNNLLGKDVSTNINGLTIGLTHKGRFRIGIGAYLSKAQSAKAFMITNQLYINRIKILAPNAASITTNTQKGYLINSNLKMYYITPSFEYVFFQSKWIDLSIPLEIGIGYSKMDLSDFFNNTPIPIINSKGKQLKGDDVFFPALLGLNAMLNLSPDVGLSASIGYRKILKEIGISQNFDGLYYQIGLQLIPERIQSEIKKDFVNWKKKRKVSTKKDSLLLTPTNGQHLI